MSDLHEIKFSWRHRLPSGYRVVWSDIRRSYMWQHIDTATLGGATNDRWEAYRGAWGRFRSSNPEHDSADGYDIRFMSPWYIKPRKLTPTYSTWLAMRDRCLNPKAKAFPHYGGKGVTICDRWRESFEAFLEDMGERPKSKTLDREDASGNYEPQNCKWATSKEQTAKLPQNQKGYKPKKRAA